MGFSGIEDLDVEEAITLATHVRGGGVHVNREQVAKRIAWRYVQYDKRNEFGGLEEEACRHRRGLLADAHAVAPWEWRKSERERKAAR